MTVSHFWPCLTSFLFMRQILILTITWYRGCQNKFSSLDQLAVFDKFKKSMLTNFQIQISRLKLCWNTGIWQNYVTHQRAKCFLQITCKTFFMLKPTNEIKRYTQLYLLWQTDYQDLYVRNSQVAVKACCLLSSEVWVKLRFGHNVFKMMTMVRMCLNFY